MAETRRYAEGTMVPVDRSRWELERLLRKHGANEFGTFEDAEGRTVVIYRLAGRMIRHEIKRPEFRTETKVQAELRRRWRGLVLITKAKLEQIAAGDSSVEKEFLADVLLHDKRTVIETIAAQLEEQYTSENPPALRLGSGS